MTRYHKAGRLLQLVGWLGLIPPAFITVATAPGVLSGDPTATPVATGLIVLVLVGVALVYLKVGSNIKQHRDRARSAGFALGGLALLAFPIGTLIGGFILYYLGAGWDD